MTTVAIVQARMGSTRLPDKVMRMIDGEPMIGLLLRRLSLSKHIDSIVLATSNDPRNAPLAAYVRSLGYQVVEGSEDDVLDRFRQAATASDADTVIRVTGDCPLIDAAVVDAAIDLYRNSGAPYVSNVGEPTFPDGLDVEVFSSSILERAWKEAHERGDREHVTPYIRRLTQDRRRDLVNDEDLSAERWTVDEPEDFELISAVFGHFHPVWDFGWRDVLALSRSKPELFSKNRHLVRNAGAEMGTGQKLWQRAKRVIPGGSMLLSKRPEMFLPDQWPAYFSRAAGCRVWDMDGREYIDMSLMGVGTNTLGYGHPEVDGAVRRTVDAGNLSTLNCPEEVWLAERLVELHPWADMVRFARSGGEANAVAVRIARAASGRDKVAICGYHGWHDWYLSTNLGNEKGLDGHLLPGLEPRGVPRDLYGTVFPFHYNRLDELEAVIRDHPDVGVIKMEVQRNEPPADGFLESVRRIASERGIVLVFDECTSGFRETFGGLHKKYGVEPDMAVFGKTLGNGYAITAVAGRREVMEAAQDTFISSTFWTERIGPSAALATLDVMERERSWETITRTGRQIADGWNQLGARHGLQIRISGLPALVAFGFDNPANLAYKTLISQEMLAKGYLAGNAVYTSIAHTPDVVTAYFEALDSVFGLVRECEDGRDVMKLLKGPICHGGFRRLN